MASDGCCIYVHTSIQDLFFSFLFRTYFIPMSTVQSVVVGNNSNEVNEAYVASGGAQSLPVLRDIEVLSSGTNSLPVDSDAREDGYDEVFDPPVSSDYECPICINCLRDPVQTDCGHRFCKNCIERHVRLNAPKCPVDNQELQRIFPDNFAKREISQFLVRCRTVRDDKSCTWKGELGKLEAHLAVCEFVNVLCPNTCGQHIERKLLDTHIKKECSKRKVICQHCKTDVLYKNLKDHIDRCQKVQINCPNCKQKMLREKLQAHLVECPKVQIYCDFRDHGCKWTGARLTLANHIQQDMVRHISYLRAATAKLERERRSNGEEAQATAQAASTSSSSNDSLSTKGLEELNRKVDKNAHSINNLRTQVEQMERRVQDELTALTQRAEQYNAGALEMKRNMAELEARMCNGVFLWRIKDYNKHLQEAVRGLTTAQHSSPFYTSYYGYKFCLRINPNGVDTGYGTHVSLFIHMMQSEWDDILEWPFSGRISLSILDQSDDGEHKRHISETLVTRPNLLAFQRPTTPRNHKGYGYVEFAYLETLRERQYVKNDCLLVRAQVFQ